RQQRARFVDERDAGDVGEPSERGCAESADAEGKSEKQSGDEADAPREQFLGEDENRRERRRQNQSNDDAQDRRPEERRVRQEQRERQDAEDRNPNHQFSPEAIANGAADERAGGDGAEKNKQVHLRTLHRDAEALDEKERVVAADACQVDVLRKNQRE